MKNKGIVIELTALLDVILIMLFWIMMTAEQNSENARADAESRISYAEELVKSAEKNAMESESRAEIAVAESERMREELEKMRIEYEEEIAEAWKKAASINDNAAANQLALENFEKGIPITLNITYDESAKVIVSDSDYLIGEVTVISEENIKEVLVSSLERKALQKDDVILCAVIYDGSKALYRDVKSVRTAVSDVKEVYKNLYCTYINMKEKEKNNE